MTKNEAEDRVLSEEAIKVNPHWRVDRHEGEDDIVYELEVYDHQGEGNSVQWFQQYKGMPRGSAEKELMSFLRHTTRALSDALEPIMAEPRVVLSLPNATRESLSDSIPFDELNTDLGIARFLAGLFWGQTWLLRDCIVDAEESPLPAEYRDDPDGEWREVRFFVKVEKGEVTND